MKASLLCKASKPQYYWRQAPRCSLLCDQGCKVDQCVCWTLQAMYFSLLLYFPFFFLWFPSKQHRVSSHLWMSSGGDLLWVAVLIEYCMVHGQIQGCNLTNRFTDGLWMTVKLPSMTRVINLVRCRINVVFRMIIYHLKFGRDCVQEVNSCAEGHVEGRRKIPACIVSQVHSSVILMRIAH